MKKAYLRLSIIVIMIVLSGNITNISSLEKSIQPYCDLSRDGINDSLEKRLDVENIDDDLYKLYKEVLVSQKPFTFELVVAEGEKEYYLNDISYEEYKYLPQHFSLIDMNKDTIPEIVIEGTVGMSAGFVLVLREYDGKIIGHDFSHRQMSDIKIDGTYHSSGGAAYNGYYYLSFERDSYIENNIVKMDLEEDSNGEYKQIYLIDDRKVSEDKFNEAWGFEEKKKAPEWIDFR